jgi:hypothetical protein
MEGKYLKYMEKMQSLKLVVLSVKILIILYMAADTQSSKNMKHKTEEERNLKVVIKHWNRNQLVRGMDEGDILRPPF